MTLLPLPTVLPNKAL